MSKVGKLAVDVIKIAVGCALFALGFDLFLLPNDLNVGGISGLAMVLVHLLGFGTVGMITALVNLPLFALGGWKGNKKFLFGSLLGMLLSSTFIDLFTLLPHPETEPLIGALYGGVFCGVGLGLVFAAGFSTGGSDIIIRLLKLKWRNVPIGTLSICFDLCVAILTGVVFQDFSRTLYSGVTIYLTGRIIDGVVYRFDYTKVALIISEHHESIVDAIGKKLDRGATYLYGEGTYTHQEKKVVLAAVKRQQLAELKQLVVQIDPDAFVIVQEAHQVLGDGFSKYSKDSL